MKIQREDWGLKLRYPKTETDPNLHLQWSLSFAQSSPFSSNCTVGKRSLLEIDNLRGRTQTCQPLVKENLEILQNIVRFSFFPYQTPFPSRELDTNLIPRAHSPFKMADRRGEKRYVIEHK